MATFKICVFKHQKRKDGKYPVSIRLCHQRKYSYIPTGFNVTADQINKRNFEVKDTAILRECHERIEKMERIIAGNLGFKKEAYDAKTLSQYLLNKLEIGEGLDFVDYAEKVIERKINAGQHQTAMCFKRSLNSLIEFCNGRRKILFQEITGSFLVQYVNFLSTRRQVTRVNRKGVKETKWREPMTPASRSDYVSNIRTIFNEARREYNSDEEMVIKNYPFHAVQMVRSSTTRRVLADVDVKKILAFNDYCVSFPGCPPGIRETWCRAAAVFSLSFYLCGLNTADIFDLRPPKDGKVSYYRRKTKTRRSDLAFAKMAIPTEAIKTFEKYKDEKGEFAFNFNRHFSNYLQFNAHTNRALKLVAKLLEIEKDLTTYYARHSWATIARNKAGVSRDDIDLALNHVDMTLKMADVYIEKDFSMIDVANRKVIDYMNGLPAPVINQSAETPKS